MLGNISEPPKMILTLVAEVGADEQDGATESAGPRLVIDVAVPGRQETGTIVAGELVLSGTYAHTAVHPVRLSKLQGRAGPASMMCWREWRRSDSRSQDGHRRPFQFVS